MERIGTQVNLPWSVILQITLQGIRIRLGRAVVTLSGVVLGIAFLMNVMTGELIKNAVTTEQLVRQNTTLMNAVMQSEIGTPTGKTLGLVVAGTLSPAEHNLINDIIAAKPAMLHAIGYTGAGVTSCALSDIGKDASLVLLLGSDKQAPASLTTLAQGMQQRVVVDAMTNRTFPGTADPSVRRVSMFASQESSASEIAQKAREERARMVWVVVISLLVTVIGITNALLMSVTERFKEIGTMKCLGALSTFIRRLYLLESGIIGMVGSVFGVVLGVIIPMVSYGIIYGMGLVFGAMNYPMLLLYVGCTLLVGVLLSIVAAIYPANFAAKMIPAMALRSNV